MSLYFLYILVVGLNYALGEPSLQIIKKVEETFIPISDVVEETVGSRFSLLCELVFSGNQSGFDESISWVKQRLNTPSSRRIDFEEIANNNLEQFYSSLTASELNKAVKNFNPLKIEDTGSYVCFSLKFKQFRLLNVVVRNGNRIPLEVRYPFRESLFCSEQMFKCRSNGVCIIEHYVCDGKPDCKDGSDETFENCNGDPCKGKLQCEDGRCIPTAWCCDRNEDVNCTVTNRPKCCQVPLDNYEELENDPNLTTRQQTQTGARYLFISVCILSILFSIVLLLLILSKVVIFAKKTALQQSRLSQCNNQNIVVYQNPELSRICTNYPYELSWLIRNRSVASENCDISDPLLDPFRCDRFPRRSSPNVIATDQPPAYRDILRDRNNRLNISEPPPPYTSREILNEVTNESVI